MIIVKRLFNVYCKAFITFRIYREVLEMKDQFLLLKHYHMKSIVDLWFNKLLITCFHNLKEVMLSIMNWIQTIYLVFQMVLVKNWTNRHQLLLVANQWMVLNLNKGEKIVIYFYLLTILRSRILQIRKDQNLQIW